MSTTARSAAFASLTGPHGIDLAAPGGIEALLNFHRAHFGSAQMSAADGGEGAGGQQEPGGAGEGGQGAAGQGAGQGAGEADRGFPANTALADMNDKQQAAYWKFQSRKHEDAAKNLAARSDYDDVKRARDQAVAEAEALRQAQMSESEKALAAARSEGEQAARAAAAAEFSEHERARGIKLVDSFLALTMGEGGRLERDRERIAPVLKALDKTTFVTAEGDVDADALNAFVNSLVTPAATGSGRSGAREWPSLGQGRQSAPPSEKGVGAGKAMFASRRGTPAKS